MKSNEMESLVITEIETEAIPPYFLLELADPSRSMIDTYLATGHCFLARQAEKTIGVIVLNAINPGTIKIMNVAVAESKQGQGLGKRLLYFAEQWSRDQGYFRLRIGTGNSSIQQLALYQRQGFEIMGIERDFFTKHYPEPIIENGIPCRHKILLEKLL